MAELIIEKPKNQKIVYVAGPYTKGDVALNVRNAVQTGMVIADRGHYPVIPHLTHFMHLMFPKGYDYWITLDNIIIPKCDALIQLPGKSKGADKEALLAINYGLQVFIDLRRLIAWLEDD